MCHIYFILNLLKYFLHNSLKLRRLKDFIDTLSCKLILIMFTFVVRLTVNIGYHTVFYYEQSALVVVRSVRSNNYQRTQHKMKGIPLVILGKQ